MRHNLQDLIPRSITDKIIQSRFKDRIYDIDGHKMYLNEGLFSLSLGEPFEPLETKVIKALVKPGETVVDLGANVGYYTLLLARQVGRNGRVIAFEPSPENFDLLKRNIELNGYQNIEANQMAVCNRSGRRKLSLSVHPGDNRIYTEPGGAIKDKGLIDIEATSLDDFLQGSLAEIHFIKMDIQGAEYSAVVGMQSILEKNKNIKLLTEFSPKLLTEFRTDPSQYLNVLERYGFLFYNLDSKSPRLELTTAEDLLKRYSQYKEDYSNILLVREPLGTSCVECL